MALFLPSLKKSGHLERIQMTIAIIGSRKLEARDDYAIQGWEIFAPRLTIYGFDADQDACFEMNAELQTRQVNWVEKHIPVALGNYVGKAKLYVTEFPGCTSLYPPNESYMARFAGYQEMIKLQSTLEIETTTLDEFCESENINEIDFLHLDVQGGELSVLQGAAQILKKSVLAIATEVEFTHIYIDQPLFSDLDVYLRNQDFTLLDLVISTGRGRRTSSPIVSNIHTGSLIWGDAYYFRDLIRDDLSTHLRTPEQIFKLACLADIMNFTDYALELLEYLTLKYGKDPKYNFSNNIIEGLAQVPELLQQGLASLPIVTRIKDYISDYELE
ncbi:MAG: FkbM family methyltransferase [Symploca sp. SIO1B1]|nr:FkbM family methyltransferase [Symploca sp. SIO1B1]